MKSILHSFDTIFAVMAALHSSTFQKTSISGALLQRAVSVLLKGRDRIPVGDSALRHSQSKILSNLLRYLAPTARGQALGLDRLAKLPESLRTQAFRELPVEHYNDVAAFIDRTAKGESNVLFPGKALALAQTSGTTSAQGSGERYIPQSKRLLAQHARGATTALSRLTRATGSSLFGGRLLMLGGSTNLVSNEWGIPVGDLSGITVSRIPWILSSLYEPGRKLALESDWTKKVQGISSKLCREDVRLVSGIPSWTQVLFQEVCQTRNCPAIREAWPSLEAFIHGGVSIDPYLPMLAEHLSPQTWMMEVYPTSEAFIAVGSRPWRLEEGRAPDLELLTSHDLYFEFLREDLVDRPDLAVGAEALEVGALYRVLLTTPGGLVRHQIGDLVEGTGPGRIRFAGRIKLRLSVFGEHVEGSQLSEALAQACLATDSTVVEWHVAPVLPTSIDPRGRHEWWVEFGRPPKDVERFRGVLDDVLQRTVLDYQAHRTGDVQLLAPTLNILPPGTFQKALRRRGQLGGQHKVPSAWNDRSWADLLSQTLGDPS